PSRLFVQNLVLALLPVGMAGYFLTVNPSYLLHMWNDDSGKIMLSMAFVLQATGCVVLWRMLRSI
ncbi:type II secretion system F family protein, partial [Pseudomonas amygdali]|uniref:type II secretion system F family protein n=1 Tax=Pseudomonas amygdali TaxID=47877 RepID=UPI00352AB487